MRKGGVLQQPPNVQLENGHLLVVEAWHWRWFSLWCNWRNVHEHGWVIVSKRKHLLHQNVLMVKYWPNRPVA